MKHRKQKMRAPKRLCLALVSLALVSIFTIGSGAVSPSYSVSEDYKSGKYYTQLLDVEKSGNERYDTARVALSQLGYHEGNSSRELEGYSNGSQNYTEYCRMQYIISERNYEWCAAFVSWCLRQAGVSESRAPSEISCQRMVNKHTSLGIFHSNASYTPRPGDIIFFKFGTSYSNHVGLVLGVKNGLVYTIEGNQSDAVQVESYSLSSPSIYGYSSPSYYGSSIPSSPFIQTGSVRETGKYVTYASSLNLRKSYTTSSASIGKIPAGTQLSVYKTNGKWGQVSYGGKTGWISLDYALLLESESSQTYSLDTSKNGTYTVNAKNGLNVRSGPSTSYPKITALFYGSTVRVVGVYNGWAKIEGYGKDAFASLQYLSSKSRATQTLVARTNKKPDFDSGSLVLNPAPTPSNKSYSPLVSDRAKPKKDEIC